MKVALILGLYLVVMLHAQSGGFKKKWKFYKMQHQRKFNKSEEMRRFNLFERNKKKLELHNQRYKTGNVTFRVSENQFTDMNETRVRTIMNGFKLTRTHNKTLPIDSFTGFNFPMEDEQPLPESVDWRLHNVVTPPKNQGRCASCWSFSAIGSVEGQMAIKNGKLTPLSAQYLVDCSNGYGNVGCKGGQPDNAFEFMINNGGVISEELYPYKGSYAVLVVGYGTENGKDYWLVKNSWGASWGEQGYIKMTRNSNNQCAIAGHVSYPLV